MRRVGIKDVAARAGVSMSSVSNALNRPERGGRRHRSTRAGGGGRARICAAAGGAAAAHRAQRAARHDGHQHHEPLLRRPRQRSRGCRGQSAGACLWATATMTKRRSASTSGSSSACRSKARWSLRSAKTASGLNGGWGGASRSSSSIGSTTRACSTRCRWTMRGRSHGRRAPHLARVGLRLAFLGAREEVRQVRERLQRRPPGGGGPPRRQPRTDVEPADDPGPRRLAWAPGSRSVPRASARTGSWTAPTTISRAVSCTKFPPRGGMRVPEDVAVVGYDDIEFGAVAAVPLTSVRQPAREMGRVAGLRLMQLHLRRRPGLGSHHPVRA